MVALSGSCDDGDPCTTGDACDEGECKGEPKTCGTLEECNPASGDCVCVSGARRCGGTCMNVACCPGTTDGSCGECLGTRTCRHDGTGYDCVGAYGNCTPGWSCSGDNDGCGCPVGQRRECIDCYISGCF